MRLILRVAVHSHTILKNNAILNLKIGISHILVLVCDTIPLVSYVRRNRNKSRASVTSQTLTVQQANLGINFGPDQRSHAGHAAD